jgi:hypothetical protein
MHLISNNCLARNVQSPAGGMIISVLTSSGGTCTLPAVAPGIGGLVAGLVQWEREVQLYISLKRLRLFRQHKLWKGFKSWRHSIRSSKMAAAKTSLCKNLFVLSPIFQGALQQFHLLCYELGRMRLHAMQSNKV